VLAVLTTAGILYANIGPVIVTGLAQRPEFSAETAGYVFSSNMYGTAVGGFGIIFLVRRLSWRRAAAVLLVLLMGADLLSAWISTASHLYVVRFVHGLTGGALIGVGLSVIARTTSPERTFALLIMIQLLLGGVGAAVLTPLLLEVGTGVVWLSLIGFTVLALVLLPLLGAYPATQRSDVAETASGRAPWVPIGFALIALFVFQAGEMAAFVYVIELGMSYQLGEGFTSMVVAVSLWVGAPAALLVAWWSTRSGRLVPVVAGMFLTTLSVMLLLVPEASVFLLANVCFGIFFGISFPYLVGVASEMDNDGQMAALAGFVSSLGLATGPAIGAALVGQGEYQLVVVFAVSALALSVGLIAYPARMLDGRSKHGRVTW